MFLDIGKIHRKTPVPLFSMQASACNFIKNRSWYRCFPVSFVKFLRTPFLKNTEHLQWLLLSGRLLLDIETVSWNFVNVFRLSDYFIMENISSRCERMKYILELSRYATQQLLFPKSNYFHIIWAQALQI